VRVVSKGDRWPAGPFMAIVCGLALAVALSVGYTTWAIGYHARQACAELRIIATAPGAETPYDRTVKREYGALYKLRCG
jgi:hypothetical protein